MGKFDSRFSGSIGDVTCELLHKKSSRKTIVMMKKSGFASKEDANEWAKAELARLTADREANIAESKKKSEEKKAFLDKIETCSFVELAKLFDEQTSSQHELIRRTLERRMHELWERYIWERVAKHGVSETEGVRSANDSVGKNWKQSLKRAKEGKLDAVREILDEASINRATALRDMGARFIHEGTDKAKNLLSKIKNIPGSKIVTVSVGDTSQRFDISAEGKVGYESYHQNEFLYLVDGCFGKGVNSIIVRQFIPNSEEEVVVKNGKKIMMPWKAVSAIRFMNGVVEAVTAEEMEICNTTMQDGSKVKEDMVIYKDGSEFIS